MYPDAAASGPRTVCSTQGASRPCARSDANALSSQSRAETSSRPAKSAAPRRPCRRTAFSASAAPCRDQSSVPSTPNARSASGKKPASSARHASPSPAWWRSSSAALASAVRSRNALSPSGESVAVGSSVFTYSSPCAARASPSCACAGPPTQRGCQALKTSCLKPGCVSSAVLIAPPNQSFRSSTSTRQPACDSNAPHARPLTPLPTTIASYSANDLPELLVGDEASLLRPALLDGGQHLRAPLFGNVEPQLLGLDPDRVEAALLPQHDRAIGGDELGRIRLDRRRVVELRCDRAALTPVERVAGDRLPRLEVVLRKLAHPRRDLAD